MLFSPGETNVQDGDGANTVGNLSGELNMWVNGINIWKELLAMFAYWMTKVSSTYLSQSLGGLGAVLMALDLNSS